MQSKIDVSSGPLADHTLELYHRASFVELFALLLSECSHAQDLIFEDSLTGFYYAAKDLANLARAVNSRASSET